MGTLKNQTTVDGTGPAAALTSGSGATGVLSFLPGQKLSACTCAKEDHPGPNVKVGRGSPEIDLIEAQVTTPKGATAIGQASQSAQFAPFDDAYNWKIAGANIFDATAYVLVLDVSCVVLKDQCHIVSSIILDRPLIVTRVVSIKSLCQW